MSTEPNEYPPGAQCGTFGVTAQPPIYGTVEEPINLSYAPRQPISQSPFQASDEIPPFSVPYPWWEDESEIILRAFDALEIRRVIRFGLFSDPGAPETILLDRNHSTIEKLLIDLAEPSERLITANLSHSERVNMILCRCRSSSPPYEPWSWPPTAGSWDLEPTDIADAIDAESYRHFSHISFDELVRYSLGYSSTSVDWFFHQHTAFYSRLCDYIHHFPHQKERFLKVEKHLRSRSPFAHRAVTRCLLAAGSHDISSDSVRPFEFIAGPVQNLFRSRSPSLKDTLKVLSVLDVRFQCMYRRSQQINWTTHFDVALPFLQNLLQWASATEFADSLTKDDKVLFGRLTVQRNIEQNPKYTDIFRAWELLRVHVWECAMGLPDKIQYIQECVGALLSISNYHSSTAILAGLHEYNQLILTTHPTTNTVTVQSVPPPDILQSTGNFAVYRQLFHQSPGIPFLVPHVTEWQDRGVEQLSQQSLQTLEEMFQQMRSAIH